jgi:hypothetical protein
VEDPRKLDQSPKIELGPFSQHAVEDLAAALLPRAIKTGSSQRASGVSVRPRGRRFSS